MTQQFQHLPEAPRFNRIVMGTLMSAIGVLVGILTFAPYSLI